MNGRYLEAAKRTYEKVSPLLADYPIFWQIGHAFDTLLDFWMATNLPPIDGGYLAPILKKFLCRQSAPWIDESTGRDPWWYDDHGWWGIASLRVNPSLFSGENSKLFSGIADLSWQPFYRNAPNVWDNADQKFFADFAPLFHERPSPDRRPVPRGVWNWIYSEKEIVGTPFTPSIPGVQDGLRGMQNTVTNALYWVLMARLYRLRGTEEFRFEAEDEYKFLSTWFDYDDRSTSVSTRLLHYYDGPDAARALVRERVGVYKNGDSVPGYNTKFAWAGDQGLILGGLVEQMAIVKDVNAPSAQQEYDRMLSWAKHITNGVLDKLKGKEGELLPWFPYLHPDDHKSDHGAPSGDFDDYSTGIGVYMRYLLAAYSQNADIKAHLVATGYPDFVKANAEYVMKHQDDGDRQGRPFLNYVNDLASLVAAARMT